MYIFKIILSAFFNVPKTYICTAKSEETSIMIETTYYFYVFSSRDKYLKVFRT